jgi:hypothetical protein
MASVSAATITKLHPSVDTSIDWYDSFSTDRSITTVAEVDSGDARGTLRGGGSINISSGELNTVGSPTYFISGPFRNVEFTAYGKVADGFDETPWTAYSGMTMQTRTTNDQIATDSCKAATYDSKLFLQSAELGFVKEFDNPGDILYGEYAKMRNDPIQDTDYKAKFLGMKVVCRDTDDGVLIQTYLDKTEGLNGGTWELYATASDTASDPWPAEGFTSDTGFPCAYPFKSQNTSNYNTPFSFVGSGVALKTDRTEMAWKWASVREIENAKGVAPLVTGDDTTASTAPDKPADDTFIGVGRLVWIGLAVSFGVAALILFVLRAKVPYGTAFASVALGMAVFSSMGLVGSFVAGGDTSGNTAGGVTTGPCQLDSAGDGVFADATVTTATWNTFIYNGCTTEGRTKAWADKAGSWGTCSGSCPMATWKHQNGMKADLAGGTPSFVVAEDSQFYKYDQAAEYYEGGVVNTGRTSVLNATSLLAGTTFANDATDKEALDLCMATCDAATGCGAFRTRAGRCYFYTKLGDTGTPDDGGYNAYIKL